MDHILILCRVASTIVSLLSNLGRFISIAIHGRLFSACDSFAVLDISLRGHGSSTTHSTAHAATTSMMMATAMHIITIPALRLLPIRRDHSWLIAATSHVTHRHRLAIEIPTIAAGKVWSAVAATSSTTTGTATTSSRWISALVFWFSLFDINSAPVDLCNRVIFNQILSNSFCSESNKAEATRRSSVDILQDYGVLDFTKLVEVLFKLLTGEFKVEATNKNLALRVSELDSIL